MAPKPAPAKPSWEPCSAIPEHAIAEAGMDDQPPQAETRVGKTISFDCGYQSNETHYTVIVTASLEPLSDRRLDTRFKPVRETTLGGRNVLVSAYHNVSCHFAVEVEPGMVEFQVRYSGVEEVSQSLDAACSLAQDVATVFQYYLPSQLD